MAPKTSRFHKLTLLSLLYFVQGLPFGFQAIALPVYLRARGVSLTGVSLLGALALPWMLKPLWAPLVDRYGSARFGRRLSWIVPMQVGLALTCLFAAFAPTDGSLTLLLCLVLLMNAFAATMDIAVDGLAIDLLAAEELGVGNATQVVGYKAGMLTGGGLLVWASAAIGWAGLFASMAGLVALVLVVTLFHREAPAVTSEGRERARVHFRDVVAILRATLAKRGALIALSVIATYKLGEAMADAMFPPFLVDQGVSPSDIGLWVGTYGMAFSLAGSLAGGMLSSRLPLVRALGIAAALRVFPIAAEGLLTLTTPSSTAIIATTCAEHFFGGALTTSMFAFMMSRVDKRIGATHYTLLATIEVIGKSPSAFLSGAIADAFGYPPVYLAATAISLAFLGLFIPLSRSSGPSTQAG